MVLIKINGITFLTSPNISILEACLFVGIFIPRFCYHENLSIAGNCRMCLVEIEKSPKPVAACAVPIFNNMIIFTDTVLVKKARENIIEVLLKNHPLDCPICDQAGECDLQDQTNKYGSVRDRNFIGRRPVEDKFLGSLIKTIMTRCIHCTRCVRFSNEVASTFSLGTLKRGEQTEIGGYTETLFNSEFSGTVIDLCPVGALTSKQYAFKVRPWELRLFESSDVTDSTLIPIQVHVKGDTVVRIQPKLKDFNFLISDKTRYSFDALNKNRIRHVFYQETSKKFKIKTWSFLYNLIINLIKEKNNILFLIEDTFDFKTSAELKVLNVHFKDSNIQTAILNLNKLDDYSNKVTNNKVVLAGIPSKICFILGTNLKLENLVLNTQLRLKYFYQNLDVIACGRYCENIFPMQFFNLNISFIFNLIEGKLKVSKSLLKYQNPILIFGKALENRNIQFNACCVIMNKILPSCVKIFTHKNVGGEGIQNLSFKTLNKKQIKKTDIFICVGLNDTINLRRILFLDTKKLFWWFNTHGQTTVCQNASVVIPQLTFLEESKNFIDINKNIKETTPVVPNNYNVQPFFSLLNVIRGFFSLNDQCGFALEYFLFQIKYQKNLNTTHEKNIVKDFSFAKKIWRNSNTLIKKHPFKSLIEDFYMDNTFCKNSAALILRSHELRRLYKNV